MIWLMRLHARMVRLKPPCVEATEAAVVGVATGGAAAVRVRLKLADTEGEKEVHQDGCDRSGLRRQQPETRTCLASVGLQASQEL